MEVGQKVRLPNGEMGEILKWNGYDWQAIVLTRDGKRVPCHPVRLVPAANSAATETESK